MQTFVLSGRAQLKLMRHQYRVANQASNLRAVERVLVGSLAACDARTQAEMLGTYLESVQELRVQLQRLEAVTAALANRASGFSTDAEQLLAE